ncbi:MAG: hypothetical protein ACKV22_34370 [Bryobacteraceae bacterium]
MKRILSPLGVSVIFVLRLVGSASSAEQQSIDWRKAVVLDASQESRYAGSVRSGNSRTRATYSHIRTYMLRDKESGGVVMVQENKRPVGFGKLTFERQASSDFVAGEVVRYAIDTKRSEVSVEAGGRVHKLKFLRTVQMDSPPSSERKADAKEDK